MKANQKGFSVVELLIVIVVIGLLASLGWLVYDRQNKSSHLPAKTQTNDQTQKVGEATTYTFKELGIAMKILDGWSVETTTTKQDAVNFYEWTVKKASADGKIFLKSTGFSGGFSGCSSDLGSLSVTTIKEVTTTQNPKLMFMSWSNANPYDGEVVTQTGIVQTEQAIFRTTDSISATPIANKDLQAGDYYSCNGDPGPGFSLALNSEASLPGSSRRDIISAKANSSSESLNKPLPTDARSYADIKTMLTSIK